MAKTLVNVLSCRWCQTRWAITLSMFLAGPFASVRLAATQSLDGVWQSEGYGNVYEIRGKTLNAYDVTTRTCVHNFTATRVMEENPGRDDTFKSRGQDPIVISAGKSDDDRIVNRKMRIDRTPQMPAVCTPPTANTPLGNFEVFARTFSEQYNAFDRRRVDWDRLVAENRTKVTLQTTPVQLFEIFDSMIRRLGDLHTGIQARQLKRESPDIFRPGTDRLVLKSGPDNFDTKGRRALFAVTDRAWLHGPIEKFCRGQLQYARSREGIGYLRILEFGDYARFGGDMQALESALDKIFSDTMLKALIIDMRLSFGGSDELGLAIASRLTEKEYLSSTQQVRSDPMDPGKWLTVSQIFVRPSSRPSFKGPVVELLGSITMSAAETFSQALMGRTPHIETIGQNTQGLLGEYLTRRLPNGWTFSVSNAISRTPDGGMFEVLGIPPDIHKPVFADDDVDAGVDPSLTMAIHILAGKN
jgi:hypothetical protein